MNAYTSYLSQAFLASSMFEHLPEHSMEAAKSKNDERYKGVENY